MQNWEIMTLSPGEGRRLDIGPLHLWAQRTEHDWRIAWAGNEPFAERRDDGLEAEDPPEDVEWNRWAATPGHDTLHLVPVLPDQPLVVRPDSSFRIPPGIKVRIFVRVPVWVRIETDDKTILTEVPTVHLSKTWFGEPDGGELAWALKTDALHEFEGIPVRAHEALCRVDINHKGNEQLELNRLFLRVAHLRVYRAGDRLWTNAVKAVYEGGDKVGSVDYLKSAPSQAAGAVKISDERIPVSGTLVRARAGLLKSLEADKLRWGGG